MPSKACAPKEETGLLLERNEVKHPKKIAPSFGFMSKLK